MALEKTKMSDGGNHHQGEDTNMKPMKIPVVIGKLPRTEFQIAVGLIRAEDLIPRASIAHREFEGGKGYQRLPSRLRVNLLAQSLLRQKVDLPTALLLNLRTYDPSVNLLKDDKGANFLSLTDELLWEVDGQHRCEGLKAALDENPDRFRDYTIPFVIGLGWSEDYEMEQFFVVNSNAKSVPTTIAYDILAEMGQTIPGLMKDLEESGKGWQVHGHELAKELAETSSIWRDRIRFSNQPKGMTTVASSGFVNSLKPVLALPYFGRLTRGAQTKVLTAYWEGQRKVLPAVFEQPQHFVLQKSLGVQVMHGIFNDALEVVRNNKDSVTSPDAYAKVLENTLSDLSGDTREGFQVSGKDFWLSGEHGAAGALSSSAGRRVLTARLRVGLPRIGVS